MFPALASCSPPIHFLFWFSAICWYSHMTVTISKERKRKCHHVIVFFFPGLSSNIILVICQWPLKNIWFCFWIVLVRYFELLHELFINSDKEFVIIFVVRKAGISSSAVFTQTNCKSVIHVISSTNLFKDEQTCFWVVGDFRYFLCFCKSFFSCKRYYWPSCMCSIKVPLSLHSYGWNYTRKHFSRKHFSCCYSRVSRIFME